MEHNIVDTLSVTGIRSMTLLKKGNNLDDLDNLDGIPARPAVYAICGRVNGAPANPRVVDCTLDLQAAIRAHFEPEGAGAAATAGYDGTADNGTANGAPPGAATAGAAATAGTDQGVGECVRSFMQSIKIKELVYELLTDVSPGMLQEKKEAWTERFKPACNETLNKVY